MGSLGLHGLSQWCAALIAVVFCIGVSCATLRTKHHVHPLVSEICRLSRSEITFDKAPDKWKVNWILALIGQNPVESDDGGEQVKRTCFETQPRS